MSSINPILKKAMKGTASIAAALTYGIAINLRIGFRGVEDFSLFTSIFLKNSHKITNSLEMLFKSRLHSLIIISSSIKIFIITIVLITVKNLKDNGPINVILSNPP